MTILIKANQRPGYRACPPLPPCPHCDDVTIHQNNRGVRESSSGLGQYINETFENTFFFCDIDGVTVKRSTRAFRLFEKKFKDQRLSDGQAFILPLLALALKALRLKGWKTAVYVIYSDDLTRGGDVQRVTPFGLGRKRHYRGLELDRLLSGQ